MKRIYLTLILISSMFLLSGCYDAKKIEDIGYVIAIGLDKGTHKPLKLSLQFAVIENSNSSGTSSQSSSTTVATIDCETIDSGISLINSYVSKKINLSHCKEIIISEELAYEGISEYVYTFASSIEVRPDCNVIISRCNAEDLLSGYSPVLETVSARYYELALNSSKYSGYTEILSLSDFYSALLSTTSDPIAILAGINSTSTHNTKSSNDVQSIDGNYEADETPIGNEANIENIGIAVFNGDKLVGELDNMETLCHLIVTNKLENATITIPDPYDIESNISLYISRLKESKNSVKLINNYPYIKCRVFLTANVLTLDESLNLSDEEQLKVIEEYANSYLKENIYNYLYKTSKEFRADIDDFGKHLLPQYFTWKEWTDSDWLNNYQNAFFSVEVYTTVKSGYLFTKL